MSVTVVPLPPNSSSETTDFLRRMASMVSGRNGEMLLRAAALIESLSQRAMTAERLYHHEHEENTRNTELREAGEMASDEEHVRATSAPHPPSLRAQRSNPESFRGGNLDGLVARLLAMTSPTARPA